MSKSTLQTSRRFGVVLVTIFVIVAITVFGEDNTLADTVITAMIWLGSAAIFGYTFEDIAEKLSPVWKQVMTDVSANKPIMEIVLATFSEFNESLDNLIEAINSEDIEKIKAILTEIKDLKSLLDSFNKE